MKMPRIKCLFCVADTERITRLLKRVRDHAFAAQPADSTIELSAMLRALLRQGLELAETRELTGSHLVPNESTILLSCRIPDKDAERLSNHLNVLNAQCAAWAKFGRPDLERAIILIALTEVENRTAFPSFVISVLKSRWPKFKKAPE